MQAANMCHDSRMGHNPPPTPAFRDSSPTDPIQEMALRVVVELPGWEMHVMGTATLIGSFLAVTAKHVIDAAIGMFGALESSQLPCKCYTAVQDRTGLCRGLVKARELSARRRRFQIEVCGFH
jgi:hypothetical protein